MTYSNRFKIYKRPCATDSGISDVTGDLTTS